MLSSFAYGKVKVYFISRGYRQGVQINQVTSAFSWVVGQVKFMGRYGLSVRRAADLVLARRLLGCSERILRRWVCPVGNGVQCSVYFQVAATGPSSVAPPIRKRNRGFGPLVMLLGQHRAHQPPRRQPGGGNAHHVPFRGQTLRHRISRFSRSWGLLDHSFCKPAPANTAAMAFFSPW